MASITATGRLFLRTRATLDSDGWKHWVFPEVAAHGLCATCFGVGESFPGCICRACKGTGRATSGRIWEVVETQSGVRHSTLKRRDKWGNQHNRALRRVEEDHLMKFAIRDA